MRRFAVVAAVPGELDLRARALPASAPRRDRVAHEVEAVRPAGLHRRVREKPRGLRGVTDERDVEVVRSAIDAGARHRGDRPVRGVRPGELDRLEQDVGQPVDHAVLIAVDEARRAPAELGDRERGRDAERIPGLAADRVADAPDGAGRDDGQARIRAGIHGEPPREVGQRGDRPLAVGGGQADPRVGLEGATVAATAQLRVDRAARARALARGEATGADGDPVEKRQREPGLRAAGADRVGRRSVDRPPVLEPRRAGEGDAGLVPARTERVARDRVVAGVGDRQPQQVARRQPARQAVGGGVVERIGDGGAPERVRNVAARRRRLGRLRLAAEPE